MNQIIYDQGEEVNKFRSQNKNLALTVLEKEESIIKLEGQIEDQPVKFLLRVMKTLPSQIYYSNYTLNNCFQPLWMEENASTVTSYGGLHRSDPHSTYKQGNNNKNIC